MVSTFAKSLLDFVSSTSETWRRVRCQMEEVSWVEMILMILMILVILMTLMLMMQERLVMFDNKVVVVVVTLIEMLVMLVNK